MLFLFLYFSFIKFNYYLIKIIGIYLDLIAFFIIILFFISLYLYFLNIINIILIIFIEKKNIDLYFYSVSGIIKSVIITLFFLLYYFFYLKLLIFFCSRNIDINLFVIKSNVILHASDQKIDLILLFLILILLFFFFYIFMYLFRSIVIFYYKVHFLKLHYFFFYKFYIYRSIIFFFINFENEIKDFLYFSETKDYYSTFFLIRKILPQLLIFLIFFYCIFFKKGDLYIFLYFLPYFGLYYFIYNIYNFIIDKIVVDFDILIMIDYYEDIFFFMELNEFKKKKYISFILSNFSEFKFKDSKYFSYPEKIEPDFLMIEVHKFNINFYPHDFFSRIKKVKPKLKKKKNDFERFN